MSSKQAPILAAWMLRHLVSGRPNEALEGDLLEELESGRSISWYWRQVFGAIAVAWRREISGHRGALLFAALWSTLAPIWLTLLRTGAFSDLTATAERLHFPWSAICPVLLWLSVLHAFLWMGLLLFLYGSGLVTKNSNRPHFRQGFAWGTLFFLPVWLAAVLLVALVPLNSWLAAFFRCFPFFVATLRALWSVSWECQSADTHLLIGDEPSTQPSSPD